MNEHCVALLGKRDEPTDAVEEYCAYLAAALLPHGFSLDLVRVPWNELGWGTALKDLRRQASAWQGSWVFVQYTALAWSRRGFAFPVLRVLELLKKSGVRSAVVFHDAKSYGGARVIDRARRVVQTYTMRKVVGLADVAVLTIPLENVAWLPANHNRCTFIPVGANLPSPEKAWLQEKRSRQESPTIAVFSLSGGKVGQDEARDTVEALRYAAERHGALQLVVLGRNSKEAESQLRDGLRDIPVRIETHGLVPGEEVVDILGAADVLLFPRGPISTRRGSAIAGIACGLPVVACQSQETGGPLREAGLVLLPEGATKEFGPALLRVLSDASFRAALAERSRRAQEQYFSWRAIAAQYARMLRGAGAKT